MDSARRCASFRKAWPREFAECQFAPLLVGCICRPAMCYVSKGLTCYTLGPSVWIIATGAYAGLDAISRIEPSYKAACCHRGAFYSLQRVSDEAESPGPARWVSNGLHLAYLT